MANRPSKAVREARAWLIAHGYLIPNPTKARTKRPKKQRS